MAGLGILLSILINLFTLTLVGRLILDYVRVFSPSWRPTGFMLWIATMIYGITDPIVNFVRKFVPPLRVGPVALDLSFIVIFFAAQILGRVVLTIF
jgi:YggT family protein